MANTWLKPMPRLNRFEMMGLFSGCAALSFVIVTVSFFTVVSLFSVSVSVWKAESGVLMSAAL
jgi:hypothetical protein